VASKRTLRHEIFFIGIAEPLGKRPLRKHSL
jgi:hypothetical protein